VFSRQSRNPTGKDIVHHDGIPKKFFGCARRTVSLHGAQSAPCAIKICADKENFQLQYYEDHEV
jgi:hypothetical protein